MYPVAPVTRTFTSLSYRNWRRLTPALPPVTLLTMRHLLLASLLLAVPALAQDEPDETETSSPQGGQGAHVGGAGIQTGKKDNASGGSVRKSETASGGGTAESAGPCQEEELNWKPGKGGPATAVAGQAVRAQKQDTTIAYRVRASQLGEQGNFGFYTDSHQDSWMRLSSRKCEVTFKRSACEVDYGAVTLSFLSSGKLKELSRAPGFPKDTSRICVIPAPAGKVGGENYWWLNVHTKGPCAGGQTWFGGGKLEEGTCSRGIIYEAYEASGAPAGSSASSGGGGSSAATPPAAPKPNTCWKAPSGRTCCDVMFSPVPAECQRRK